MTPSEKLARAEEILRKVAAEAPTLPEHEATLRLYDATGAVQRLLAPEARRLRASA